MPLYNAPAVVVDLPNLTRSGGLPPETPLIFELSGQLYLGYYHIGASANQAGVYMSTDDGATWTTPDIASAPSVGNQSASYGSFGDIIYFAHVDGSLGNNWVIDQFDTSSDTYGSQFDTGLNLFTDNISFMLMLIDSVGDTYLIYHQDIITGITLTGRRVYYRKVIAGVVGSAVLVSAVGSVAEFARIEGLVIDETDRVHIIFSVAAVALANGLPKDYYWSSISSAGSVATEVLLATVASSYPNYTGPEPAVYLGQLIVFARNALGELLTHTGQTGTATPTFTDANLGFLSSLGAPSLSWPDMRPVVMQDGSLWVFWLRYVYNPVSQVVELIDQINYTTTTDGTTWTSAKVFWNEVAFPVSPGQFEQALEFLHVIQRGNTDLVVQTNAFIGLGSGVGIVIVCPLTGVAGGRVLNYIWCG